MVIPPAAPPALPSETMLAGKFKTPEDLAKGYGELAKHLGLDGVVQTTFATPAEQEAAYKKLETKLGAKPAAAPPAAPPAPPAPPVAPPNSVDEVVQRAGLDPLAVAAAFAKDGKLSDADYAALAKASGGFLSPKVIDQFIGNQLATAAKAQEQYKAQAVAIAGGETQLNTLLAWAGGLPATIANDLNARLADPVRMEGALIELQERFRQAAHAGGSMPLIQGGGAGGSSVYANNNEMRADIRHADYNRDPNYTAAVNAKVERSIRARTVQPGRIV
jgi:hypothetical protein